MSKKSYKLFIPDIFYVLYSLFKGLIGGVKIKKYQTCLVSKDKEDLVILGNGPSLTETIKKYRHIIDKKNCMVVNKFSSTELYAQIRPNYYVLVDPAFFVDYNKQTNKTVLDACKAIVDKTEWPLILYLPLYAVGSEFYRKLQSNKNISLIIFNSCGNPEVFKGLRILYKLWDKNLMAPLSMNVVNAAAIIAARERFRRIYLTGIDSSWIENYELDQKTNILYANDTHFYGDAHRTPLYMDVMMTQPSHLHQELNMVSRALENYWLIREFADYVGVKIYNSSEYSLVDAFERNKFGLYES